MLVIRGRFRPSGFLGRHPVPIEARGDLGRDAEHRMLSSFASADGGDEVVGAWAAEWPLTTRILPAAACRKPWRRRRPPCSCGQDGAEMEFAATYRVRALVHRHAAATGVGKTEFDAMGSASREVLSFASAEISNSAPALLNSSLLYPTDASPSG